jgi:hypothetical protein
MLTTKLRTTFALLAAALTVAFASFSVIATVGPVTAAHAQDNNEPEMSQDEACGLLQEAYNGASANASAARAAGNQRVYEIWANLATEAYLDAEFDWQCDWAQDGVVHSPGGIQASEGRFSIGPSAVVTGPIGPPASATKNVHGFQLWLASKNHRLACGNLGTLASSLQQAATQATRKRQTRAAAGLSSEANLINVAAHFTNCAWAAQTLPATTSGTAGKPVTSGTSAPPRTLGTSGKSATSATSVTPIRVQR